MRTRTGVHLIELLVAAALVGGPLLCCLDLAVSTPRAARFNDEQLSAEGLVLDVLEMLSSRGIDAVREVAGDASGQRLVGLLEQRLDNLPEAARAGLDRSVSSVASALTVSLKDALGDRCDLAVVTVQMRTSGGGAVRLSRVIRTRVEPL